MGLFSSSSSSKATSNAAETGQQVQDYGLGVSFSNMVIGKGGRNSFTVQNTDHGAVSAALAANENNVRDVLELANSTAINVVDVSTAALSAHEGITTTVINANSDNVRDVLDFGSYAVREALDYADRSAERASAISHASMNNSLAATRDALGANERALQEATGVSLAALTAIDDINASALDAVVQSQADAQASSMAALAHSANVTRSDNTEVLNKALEYGTYAVVAFFLSRMFGKA